MNIKHHIFHTILCVSQNFYEIVKPNHFQIVFVSFQIVCIKIPQQTQLVKFRNWRMLIRRISILLVHFVLAILLSKSYGFYLDLLSYNLEPSNNETEARLFLEAYNKEVQLLQTESTIAEWKYYTNLTDDNEKASSALSLKVGKFFVVIKNKFYMF